MARSALNLTIKHKKPIKVGNSFYLHIPTKYISDGNISPDTFYDYTLNPTTPST